MAIQETKLDFINIGFVFDDLIKEIKRRKAQPELPLTFSEKLNNLMWGMKKRKLTVIGARTSHGKSNMALQICIDLAMQNKKVVFLSLEMETLECAERLISNQCFINNFALLRGEVQDIETKVVELKESLLKKHFFISDAIGKTWQDINSLVESWNQAKTMPDLIMLDYIQNIKSNGNNKEAIDEYIRKFREMAIRYNFSAVVCCQINRSSQESEDKFPQLHQLKGSGFLEEHADVVLLLYWPWFDNRKKDINHFELNVAKNKLGLTGYLNLIYQPEFSRFKDQEEQNAWSN